MTSISGAMTSIFSTSSSSSDSKSPNMSIKLSFKLEKLTQETKSITDDGLTLDITLLVFFLIAFLSLFNVLFKGVDGVPRRSYCRTRDTFAVITVYQESSSLTTRKIRTVLTEKQTKVAKQSLNPKFNYSVLLSVASYVDLKSMKARVSIMDRDRLIKTSTIGSAIIQLKHLKPLLVSPDALEMVVTGKPTKKQVTISLLIEKE